MWRFTLKRIFLVLASILFPLESQAIINGQEIESVSGGFVVAIQMRYAENGSAVFRKGTAFAVQRKKLITAGHNVFYIDDPANIEVILSATPCWGEDVCPEKRIKVLRKIVHPRFKNDYPNPPEYDLAILELEEELPSSIRTIPIDECRNDLDGNFSIYGYGLSNGDGSLADFRLRHYRYKEKSLKPWSEQKKSLSQRDGGFCGGDSGAPLVLEYPDGEMVALGVAIHTTADSNGNYRCLTNGVFSYLPFFRDWLDENL
jgi:secreted trypsin-like serine protease